jgi:hypothetical protein
MSILLGRKAWNWPEAGDVLQTGRIVGGARKE